MHDLSNIAVPLHQVDDLHAVAANELGIPPETIRRVQLTRRSIDARRKRPRWIVSLRVHLIDDPVSETKLSRSHPAPLVARPDKRVVIVGAGPAGLFAALRFADAGVACTLLERGSVLEKRHRRAGRLRADRHLDPECNLCFGEGGAGTYSDGKLYTRKKSQRVREVYERLVAFGAAPEILYEAHPHLGTNRLIPLLRSLRQHLQEHKITLRFDTRLDDLIVSDGKLQGVRTNTGDIEADAVILATGHSARDTYAMLANRGVEMTCKPFAIGARVEHPQSLIDQIQFGAAAGHPALGAAEYFLRCQIDGRGVYSFCMCPGGFIIPTPTETGRLNVNGMSNQSRKNRFANAALVVTVSPEDFAPGNNPLRGIDYQRSVELRAFEAGGKNYNAPATRLTDLVAGRASTTLPARTSYRPGLTAGNIADVLPRYITESIVHALKTFDRRLRGYLTSEAVIVAAETTTSSPIRVLRDETCQSPSIRGLYPTGEGAGYSGGIVSSAIDGMRVAEQVLAAP